MLQNVADLIEVLNNRAEAGFIITPELVGGLSPYMCEHILRFGQFDAQHGRQITSITTKIGPHRHLTD